MSSYSTLTENQRAILFLLLEKFNNSRSFNGTNAVRQSFSCKPGDVFKEYDSDYADADARFEFECNMCALERLGLVELKFDKRQSVIQKITAVNDGIADLPAVLGIEFEPFYMGIPELKRFGEFCKPLEANDITKAEKLKK